MPTTAVVGKYEVIVGVPTLEPVLPVAPVVPVVPDEVPPPQAASNNTVSADNTMLPNDHSERDDNFINLNLFNTIFTQH